MDPAQRILLQVRLQFQRKCLKNMLSDNILEVCASITKILSKTLSPYCTVKERLKFSNIWTSSTIFMPDSQCKAVGSCGCLDSGREHARQHFHYRACYLWHSFVQYSIIIPWWRDIPINCSKYFCHIKKQSVCSSDNLQLKIQNVKLILITVVISFILAIKSLSTQISMWQSGLSWCLDQTFQAITVLSRRSHGACCSLMVPKIWLQLQ